MQDDQPNSQEQGMVPCPHCRVDNPDTHTYCSTCGGRITPEIKICEDGTIPEKEFREFVNRVCDQHFQDSEVIKKRLLADVTQQASDSLSGWLRLIDTALKYFLLAVAIVTGVAAFFGYKTYHDIHQNFTEKIGKHFAALEKEAEVTRREFRMQIQEVQAMRDYLQKIIQVTQFVTTSSNKQDMTTETKSFLDKVIKEYRDYLLTLKIVPASPVLNVEVDQKYAGFPHYDEALNRLKLDPDSAKDKDLVCRFYTTSLLAKYSQIPKLLSGLAYYFPCSWQNDPKFAETYGGILGAKRERRLQERYLKTTRRFDSLQDNPTIEDSGEVWGAVFWDIREKLGSKDADRIIARTALDFDPDGSRPDEEQRFARKLIQHAHAIQGGKRVGDVKAVLEERGMRF